MPDVPRAASARVGPDGPGSGASRAVDASTGRRSATDFLRKLGAVLLVLASALVGLIGLGTVVGDMGIPRGYGVLLILAMPVGLWFALMLTPEGGTSGYCDQNI